MRVCLICGLGNPRAAAIFEPPKRRFVDDPPIGSESAWSSVCEEMCRACGEWACRILNRQTILKWHKDIPARLAFSPYDL